MNGSGADDAEVQDAAMTSILTVATWGMTSAESAVANRLAKAAEAEAAVNLADDAAKGGTELLTQFSSSTIDDAISLVMKDPNKVAHLFPAKHNLGALVTELGGQENTVRAVLNAANGKLPASGMFNNIPVNVGGVTVFHSR